MCRRDTGNIWPEWTTLRKRTTKTATTVYLCGPATRNGDDDNRLQLPMSPWGEDDDLYACSCQRGNVVNVSYLFIKQFIAYWLPSTDYTASKRRVYPLFGSFLLSMTHLSVARTRDGEHCQTPPPPPSLDSDGDGQLSITAWHSPNSTHHHPPLLERETAAWVLIQDHHLPSLEPERGSLLAHHPS